MPAWRHPATVISGVAKRGAKGAKGDTGATGPAGPAGPAGATGQTGPAGASFSPDATLPSGKSLTGPWAVGDWASTFMGTQVEFRIPLAAEIPGTNAEYLAQGTTSASCPGFGQAAAGHLCVYTNEGTGA